MAKMSKLKRQRLIYASILSAALLIFVCTALLASQKQILPWEQTLLLHIYYWPGFLRWPALIITQFGSAWMLVGISIWLLVGHKRSQNKGLIIVINGAITYVLVEMAKHIVGRARPAELIANFHQREPLVRGFGFPSGHTAMATVVSLTLIRFLPPKWRWLPAVWIILVGLTRMYLGVHAPLDIIGGFTLGLVVICFERLFFKNKPRWVVDK